MNNVSAVTFRIGRHACNAFVPSPIRLLERLAQQCRWGKTRCLSTLRLTGSKPGQPHPSPLLPGTRPTAQSKILPLTASAFRAYRAAKLRTRSSSQKNVADKPQRPAWKAISQVRIAEIFGPTVQADKGNEVLQKLQEQRIAGTIDEGLKLDGINEKLVANALAWLRVNRPMDEDGAILARFDREEKAIVREYEAKMGRHISDAEMQGVYEPQARAKTHGIYGGESGLEYIRKHNLAKMAKKRAEQAEQEKNAPKRPPKSGPLAKPQEAQWVKHYKERAQLTSAAIPPDMSKLARLLPSAVFVAIVLSLCVLLARNYVPPPRVARFWSDLPPAAATVVTIIAMNTAVFVMWRIPPLWRFMNSYFIVIPGLPAPLSLLGNIFSHQSLQHYATNMVVLWLIGTKLHDDIGRGNFVALYLASGVLASYSSLSYFVLTNTLTTSSLGASGAMAGAIAAYLILHWDEQLHPIFIPGEISPKFSAQTAYYGLLVFELLAIWRRWKHIDHFAHVGGYLTGSVGAMALKRRAEWRKEEKRKKEAAAVAGAEGKRRRFGLDIFQAKK